ncbi:MAG: peptidylprolyl isomerase [Proteobacteria bacterium]|nr:MAG: peptidylprolyl isomerase [Pseudomonadota bacterium]
MQIAQDTVVLIHYTLTNDSGEVLDSSAGGEPLAYLHGNGNLIPGLEQALVGKATGDKLSVKIEPEDAYGAYDDDLVQQVPRAAFRGVPDVQVGMQFQAQSNLGPRLVVVKEVAGDTVTVDGNHPLAGQRLSFDVEVVGVRAATEEERAHGHVHGAGGQH